MNTAPPWNLPPHPGMFAPKRSNTGAILATVLVAVLVAAAGMVGLVSLSDKDDKDNVADVGYEYPAAEGGANTSEFAETTTRTTRTTATTTTTQRTTTTRTTPTSTTPAGPQPVLALGNNPLFAGDVGTPAVTCNLSRWNTDPQSAAAFFTSALPCLDAAWAPVLQRAGLPYFPPKLEAPAGNTINSPCTGSAGRSFAAFYCPRNNTIYMPFGSLQTDLYGARPGVYLALFAHEYGHHVQALSGVNTAYWNARYEVGADTEAGLELSRRSELQAQCFSGMFLAASYSRGSVSAELLDQARNSQDRGDHNPGQPRDHGTDAHTISWWEQGAQKNRTWQCNTWLAKPAEVA